MRRDHPLLIGLIGVLAMGWATGSATAAPSHMTESASVDHTRAGQVDRKRAHIVTRDTRLRVDRMEIEREPLSPARSRHPHIVYRPVFKPAATVDRELATQPVHPHLIEVAVGQTTIMLDPHQNLRRPTGGIDENHSLMRAQRQWLGRQAKPARVLQRPVSLSQIDEDRKTIFPRAVIPAPIEHHSPSPPPRRDIPNLVRGE